MENKESIYKNTNLMTVSQIDESKEKEKIVLAKIIEWCQNNNEKVSELNKNKILAAMHSR